MADARLKEVRRGLKQRLRLRGTDLRQAIWRDLVDSHIVDLLSRGEIDFEYLASLYLLRERKAAARRARPVVVREVAGEAAREQVLATMLARRLSRASGVIAFREEVLAGQLLSRMQLPRWIEAQARRDAAVDARSTAASPPRRPLDWLFAQGDPDFAPAPRGQEQLSPEETRGNPPAPAIPLSATLGYRTPEGAVALISVCAGGRLDRLKRIVSGNDGVCALSGWSEPAAVSFVLCGHIPTHVPGLEPLCDRAPIGPSTASSSRSPPSSHRRRSRLSTEMCDLASVLDTHVGWARSSSPWRCSPTRRGARIGPGRRCAGGGTGAIPIGASSPAATPTRGTSHARPNALGRASAGERWRRH